MSDFSLHWFILLVDVCLKSILIAATTGLLLAGCRVRNSSVKHAAGLVVLSSLVVLPLLSRVIPTIPVPVPGMAELLKTSANESASTSVAIAPKVTPEEKPDVIQTVPRAPSLPPEPAIEQGVRHDFAQQGRQPILNAAFEPPQQTAPTLEQNQFNDTKTHRASIGKYLSALSWLQIGVLLWAAGAVVMTFRLLLAIRLTHRLVTRSVELPASNPAFTVAGSLFDSARSSTRLRECSLICVPLTTGCRQPTIMLPTSWQTWTADKLAHVLTHESTHIRRRDCWTALAAEMIICAYWFHPLAWWLKQRLSALAEECCDDAAIESTGNRASYARHLLEIASVVRNQTARLNYMGLAMSHRSQVESRILAILDPTRPLSRQLTRFGLLLLAAVTLPLLTVAAALKPASGTSDNAAKPKQDQGNLAKEPQNAAAESDAKIVDLGEIKITDDGKVADTVPIPAANRTSLIAQNANINPPKSDSNSLRIHGRVTDESAAPVAKTYVGLWGLRTTVDQGYAPESLAEGITNADGRYELTVPNLSPTNFAEAHLIVRMAGKGLNWQSVDLQKKEVQTDLTLHSEEATVVRLIDAQGQPAANVSLNYMNMMRTRDKGDEQKDPEQSRRIPYSMLKAFLPAIASDSNGLLQIPYVPAGYGISVEVVGDDKFAPQELALNTGGPESRPENDSTYRGQVKNFLPGEIPSIVLAEAQIFAGTVLLGNTDTPAANAKIGIWSSQQESFGSMISIFGETDANGRFRLNPYPGVRFGITAYPPKGSPYQIRELNDLKWETGQGSRKIEIRLAAGLLAQGTVIDSVSGKPLAKASVQYLPDTVRNKNLPKDLVTGWQGVQLTDAKGQFSIPVAAGPGTLLVHAPIDTNYVLQHRGSREVQGYVSGGMRVYAHAFQKIDPGEETSASDGRQKRIDSLTIGLQPGGTVTATLVDPKGDVIQDAISTSRLSIFPTNIWWRAMPEKTINGKAEFRGLEPAVKYSVFILDPKKELGIATEISLDDPHPRIVLKPCGKAKARYVDLKGKPVKKGLNFSLSMVVTPGRSRYQNDPATFGELAADADFTANFERSDMRPRLEAGTDANGFERYDHLLPGTTYRYTAGTSPTGLIEKEFVAESGKEHDLGEIALDPN